MPGSDDNDQYKQKRSLLILLDVDHMHLDSRKDSSNPQNCWIGALEYWYKFYKDIAEKAEAQGHKVIFGVVTAKAGVDSLLREQVRGLLPLLNKHNGTNYFAKESKPHFIVRSWRRDQDGDWEDIIKFQSIVDRAHLTIPAHQFIGIPNVETLYRQDKEGLPEELKKSAAARRIAQAHKEEGQEPLVIMVDDSPTVYDDMKANGMTCTQSAHPFNEFVSNNSEPIPYNLVTQVLRDLRQELHAIVDQYINADKLDCHNEDRPSDVSQNEHQSELASTDYNTDSAIVDNTVGAASSKLTGKRQRSMAEGQSHEQLDKTHKVEVDATVTSSAQNDHSLFGSCPSPISSDEAPDLHIPSKLTR